MVEKAIYTRLIDPDNATALVALNGTKVYPVISPQTAAPPYIVYRREQTDRKRLLSGTSTKKPVATVRVTCWGEKYDTVKDMAAAVVTAVDDMHGTIGTIDVHKVEVVDEFDGEFEFETEGKEKPAYSRVVILLCHYRE